MCASNSEDFDTYQRYLQQQSDLSSSVMPDTLLGVQPPYGLTYIRQQPSFAGLKPLSSAAIFSDHPSQRAWSQSSRHPRPRASRHLRKQQPEPLRVGDLALRTLSKQLDNLWVQTHLLQKSLQWVGYDPSHSLVYHPISEAVSTDSGPKRATGK